jgi:hypothetical protein
MIFVRFFIAVMVTECLPVVYSQDLTSINIGATSLKIGMAKQDIIPALERFYEVTNCDGPSASCYVAKLKPDGLYSPVANLAFYRSALAGVIKYWEIEDEEKALPFGIAVYDAIAGLVAEGNRSCTLSLDRVSNVPSVKSKSAVITCGKHTVEVSILNWDGHGPRAQIIERLRK